VKNPRLSIVGACTPVHLEDRTTLYDWEGGHNSRYLVFYFPGRARKQLWGSPDYNLEDWLSGQLQVRGAITDAGKCLGMDPAAKARWQEWNDDIDRRTQQADARLEGTISRIPLLAAKTAVLLAWDYGGASVGDWAVDLAVLEPAIAMAELHLKSVQILISNIATTPEGRWMNSLRNAIPPGEKIALGEILRRVTLTKKQALVFLETLVERRELKRYEPIAINGPAYYERLINEGFEPFQDSPLAQAPSLSPEALGAMIPIGPADDGPE
jgi:hypothetical protein